jgi:hypothetical protein
MESAELERPSAMTSMTEVSNLEKVFGGGVRLWRPQENWMAGKLDSGHY